MSDRSEHFSTVAQNSNFAKPRPNMGNSHVDKFPLDKMTIVPLFLSRFSQTAFYVDESPNKLMGFFCSPINFKLMEIPTRFIERFAASCSA